MWRIVALVVLVPPLLSGCAFFEYFGLVPRAHETVSFNSAFTDAEILTAVERCALTANLGVWSRNGLEVTRRSVNDGVIELGPWRESNVAGYAVRASIDRRKSRLRLVVKGAGPYYSKLPVDEAVQLLSQYLSESIGDRT